MQRYTIVKTDKTGSEWRYRRSTHGRAIQTFDYHCDAGDYTDVIELLYDDEMIRWSRGALGSPKPLVRVTGGVA